MKIVQVTYTAKLSFVKKNEENISVVMNDLRAAARPGILYHCCLASDGQNFTHTAFFESDEDHQFLNALASFKRFQQELKAEGLDAPPKQESPTLVGSSRELFH